MKLILKYYTIFIILFLSCEQDNTIATIDCEGTIGGVFEYDKCGDCKHPHEPGFNSDCTDCDDNIDPCGDGSTNCDDFLVDDLCGNCGGNCIADCSEDESSCNGTWIYNECWGGTATFDEICNRCVLEGDYDSVDSDADGICDGIDSDNDDDGQCDICTGIGQPHSECTDSDIGQCVCYDQYNCDDCVDFYIDACGVCNGTGVDVDGDGVCDDIDDCLPPDIVPYAENCGECNGLFDQCGICNGDGLDEDQDGLCDNIDIDDDGNIDDSCLLGIGPNQDGVLDECGVCGGNGIAAGACACDADGQYFEDCNNSCGGNALIDECGECYNFINTDGVPYLVPPTVDADSDGLCDGTDNDGDGLCDDEGNGCDGEDDCVDIDNDTLCHDSDSCPLDDENDADGDGICESDEVVGCQDNTACDYNENATDAGDCTYEDGICETCSGETDGSGTIVDNDADDDTVCDDVDACSGFDDNIDTDSDGTADGCDDDDDDDGNDDIDDQCPYDAADDSDGDGSCDSVDLCVGDDNTGDTDSDGTCDNIDTDDDNDSFLDEDDQCHGFDDNIDSDSDGVADGCDVCNGDDATTDSDSDGTCDDIDTDDDGDSVLDENDQCPGFDDNIDSDSDSIADGCDVCNGDNSTNDTDSDGICNDIDDDDDGDSVSDEVDCNPLDSEEAVLDKNDVCCEEASIDCNNVCEGLATIDDCGICSGYIDLIDNTDDGVDNPLYITIHPSVDDDNDGECDGIDSYNDDDGQCDICTGIGQPHSECTESDIGQCVCYDQDNCDDCLGNNFDECGICNGTGVDSDEDDICDDVDDCIGNVYDGCGLCFDVFSGQGVDIDDDDLCDNYDVNGDGSIDDTCINIDNDVDENGLEICDHNDNCINVDNDVDEDGLEICDDVDDCVGAYDQCEVCNGDGTSCLVQSACDLPENTVFVYNNEEIWYNVDFDVTSFIFMFDAHLNSVFGGEASNENFVISYDNNSITGGGGTITSGCDILTYIDIEGEFNNFTDITINFDAETVSYCDTCIYGNGSGSDDGGTDDGGTDDGGTDDGGTDDGGTDDGEICSECSLSNNSITIDEDGNVYYNVDFIIGGFQFQVVGGTVTAASGGDAAANGFTVQASGAQVLGFSFTGGTIPAGCGILTELVLSGDIEGILDNGSLETGIVFSDSPGNTMTVNYESYEGFINCGSDGDSSDDGGSNECTSGVYDCVGVCDGTAVEDCAGVCNGTAIIDECGVCEGDGSSCGGEFDACIMPVNSIYIDENGIVFYNVNFDIGGFQFDLTGGATTTGGTGGDAGDAGFTVQGSGNARLLGFSFTGSSIEAGCGILTYVTFTGDITGLNEGEGFLVFSNIDGESEDVTYYNP